MKNSIVVFTMSLLVCSSTFLAGCVSENSWEKLSVNEFETQISETSPLFILDVRTQIEWEQDGHLDGAYLIPHSEIEQRASELPDNKDEPIFLHCKSGARSSTAAQTLQDLGFTDIREMELGIKAWKEAGKPVLYGE